MSAASARSFPPSGAVLAAVALLAIAATPADAAVARRGAVVMGTVLEVTVVADSEADAARMADEAVAEARRWDDALTIWRDDGELARLNEAAGRGDRPVSERLSTGLAAMLRLSAASSGAFEPATGGIAPGGGLASPRVAEVLRVSTGRAELSPGARLDPGAIGKGLALDAIVALWRSGGVRSGFLDFGGSSQAALGSPPGNADGWRVQLSAQVGSPLGILALSDASLSTSRSGAPDTRPVVDPRSGRAVPPGRLATVWARSATDADAWSTALVVSGPAGLDGARREGIEALLAEGATTRRSAGFPALEALPAAVP